MGLVLYGITAYEYWRSSLPRYTPEYGDISASGLLAACGPTSLRELTGPIIRTEGILDKMHLLVSSPSARRRSKVAEFHCCRAIDALPKGSFYQIGAGIYASSPELCFVQLASELSPLELMRAGTDLCSRYLFSPYDRMETVECEPVTTRKRLGQFIETMPKWTPGLKRARRAIRWVLENSRSPRETSLAMVMNLPSRLGGFQIPGVELNCRISPDETAGLLARRSYFEADVLLREHKRILEYESDLYHGGSQQGSHDYEKIASLQTMGYVVTPITTWQMDSFEALEALLLSVMGSMGMRNRMGDELSLRRRETHYQIMQDERRQRELPPIADMAPWRYLIARL